MRTQTGCPKYELSICSIQLDIIQQKFFWINSDACYLMCLMCYLIWIDRLNNKQNSSTNCTFIGTYDNAFQSVCCKVFFRAKSPIIIKVPIKIIIIIIIITVADASPRVPIFKVSGILRLREILDPSLVWGSIVITFH